MEALILTVVLLAASNAGADDQCLADAVEHVLPRPDLEGQIVISTRHSAGAGETRVLTKGSTEGRLVGDEGFRIASVTKTYVAATVLRLSEDGRLNLDAPIVRFLSSDLIRLLVQDGYDPDGITLRHLLSHTGGLADHAQTSQFIAAVKEHPQYEWTRLKAVESLVAWTEPVGAPGEKYAYSDTGYILLGAVVERVTGRDLPRVVRAELNLDTHSPGTYWERFEAARGAARAHQVFDDLDTYRWNPSLDLFGGGGLVAPTQDMAAFFDALLRGNVFRRAETLALMRSTAGLPAQSPYRLGLLRYEFDGVEAIGHSGFWGTLVVHEPGSKRTIAAAVTNRRDYDKLKQLVGEYVKRSAASAVPGSKVHCDEGGGADASGAFGASGTSPRKLAGA